MVPGQVVVAAVLIVLVVVFVVFVVVRHQVVQGETVMGGDEIHRRAGAAPPVVEHFRGPGHASGKVRQLAFVAFPERAYGVAKLVVPLHPAGREMPYLVTTWANVPGFGDQFHLTQDRVLAAGNQETVALVEAIVITPQNGRQVEAE